MNESKISVRYAKALLESALDKKNLDAVYQDMNHLYQICRQVNEFERFLSNPVIQQSKKKGMIHTVFSDKVTDLTLSFLDMVVQIWRSSSRRLVPLSEDRLYDVLFWGIRGIRIDMDPGRIADRLVEVTEGRINESTRLCIDNAVDALRDASARDQVLLWDQRENDLRIAEGWLKAPRVFSSLEGIDPKLSIGL